jgi:hypothetical protein
MKAKQFFIYYYFFQSKWIQLNAIKERIKNNLKQFGDYFESNQGMETAVYLDK